MIKKLLWSENFAAYSSYHLRPDIWNFDTGDGADKGIPGWGNNEREFYVKSAITAHDQLTIHATRTRQVDAPMCYYGPAEWTSGRIHTHNKVGFQYGYFEFDAKMPKGGGTWPAIWLLGQSITELGWPLCGEIDIFEGSGNLPNIVRGTVHGPDYSGDDGITGAIESTTPLYQAFNTYGLTWLPDRIEWHFNGETYSAITKEDFRNQKMMWPFDETFFLILNLAMGGWFAGEIDPSISDASFEIKEIRYFSVNDMGSLVRG